MTDLSTARPTETLNDGRGRSFGRRETFAEALVSPPPAFDARGLQARLHMLCALYAHTGSPGRRQELLESVEVTVLELAHLMAVDLLRSGWRPDEAAADHGADLGHGAGRAGEIPG